MSYADYDHAGWVERQGAASRSTGRPRRDAQGNVVGWHGMPERLNPFQARVMDILGIAMGGIYNAPVSWDTVRWGHHDERWASMGVPLRGNPRLATYDHDQLTTLVLACHQARIRMEISPYGPAGMMLWFSRRRAAKLFTDGHPDIDEAMAAYRRYVPPGHRITYREQEVQPA